MSYRVVPPTASTSKEQHVISSQATAHPITGTHDIFRHGLTNSASAAASTTQSPLQARLEKWSSSQQQLQQTLQRNTFGMGLPLRQAMELKIVSENLHNPLLYSNNPAAHPLGGTHNIHLEILQGNDETVDAADFMGSERATMEILDVSAVMERSRGI